MQTDIASLIYINSIHILDVTINEKILNYLKYIQIRMTGISHKLTESYNI